MRNIEAFYAEKPSFPLTHYTSAQGLCGMLSSASLWATHIRYLNDSREFVHAIDLARTSLKNVVRGTSSPGNRELVEILLDGLDAMQGSTWVVSLSEESDLLSQWRGYCSTGGYSLTFGPSKLEDLASRQNFVLSRCIYDRDHQVALMQELIDSALESFPAYVAEAPDDSPVSNRDKAIFYNARWFFPKVSRLASTMKDPSFFEEKEWRLIGGLYKPYVKPSHRLRGSLVVPHRVFGIADADQVIRSIDTVTIGPSESQDLAELGLHFLRQEVQMHHVQISRSAIPFRK